MTRLYTRTVKVVPTYMGSTSGTGHRDGETGARGGSMNPVACTHQGIPARGPVSRPKETFILKENYQKYLQNRK